MKKHCKAIFAVVLAFSLAFAMVSTPIAGATTAATTASALTPSLTSALSSQSALENINPNQKYEDDQLLVNFESDTPLSEQVEQLNSKLDSLRSAKARKTTDAIEQTQFLNKDSQGRSLALLTLASDVEISDALQVAQKTSSVSKAQPNYVYTLSDEFAELALSDPYAKSSNANDDINQWYLYKSGVYDAWRQTRGGSSVRVAVIDSGLLMNHDDLKGNIDTANAWDTVKGSALTGDLSGHGTHVSGIISAKTNNNIGIAGLSNNKTLILPINVFRTDPAHPSSPTASTSSIIAAFDYLFKLNLPDLKVINMSLGRYGAKDTEFEAKINEANRRGILVVAAAGNGQTSNPSWPSDYKAVVGVTATDSKDRFASFSDHNSNKDIAAPGVDLLSTWGDARNAYAYSSGTSMASPVVAGVAALLFSIDPKLSVADVKELLFSTAKDLGKKGKDDYFGNGRVDANAAMGALIGRKVTRVAFKSTPTPVMVGKTFTFKTSVNPSFATNKALNWKSSKAAVASIDSNGKLKAKKSGTAIITATAKAHPNIKATYKVTIIPAVKTISLNKKTANLKVKKKLKLKASFNPKKAKAAAITWKSSNSRVATVDAKGKVTAKKAGKVTITVKVNGTSKKATIKLTIKK